MKERAGRLAGRKNTRTDFIKKRNSERKREEEGLGAAPAI
jgi:hypothetical protein